MRTCSKCGIKKELDQFALRKTGQRKYECYECTAKWHVQYRKDNKEHIRYLRAAAKYGISYEEAKMLYNSQCHICNIKPKSTLHIDHDHVSGIVRGALCADCNNGIARFKDEIALLTGAIEYLKKTANGFIMGLRYTIVGLLFTSFLSTACVKDEPDCTVVIRVVKTPSGEVTDSYLFWSDCPDVETRND